MARSQPAPDLQHVHTLVTAVYVEAGFQCANPACGRWVTVDANHLVYVVDGGGDTLENLLPLCASCHRRSLRGQIEARAIQAWKSVITAQGSPYDLESFTFLAFLEALGEPLEVDSERLVKLHRVVASGAVSATKTTGGSWILELTVAGTLLLESWRQGQPSSG